MASNTHEDGQIVVSKANTPVSSPKNTYDLAESFSSRKSDLSKNEEQAKSSVQPDEENVENKGVDAENLSAVDGKENFVEALVPEDDNESNYIEREVNICDTCGDLGRDSKLAICVNCGIGAEHTYCMAVQIDDVPDDWYCYECIQDEEASSRKKKTESLIDYFEMAEKTSSQGRHDLNTQRFCKTIGLDLNLEPVPDLNVDPNLGLNLEPIPDMNMDPNLDLNMDPNLDLNLDAKLDVNMDLTLDCGSHYWLGSSSNYQAHRRMRAPVNPLRGQQSFEEEGEGEEQRAKRPHLELFF